MKRGYENLLKLVLVGVIILIILSFNLVSIIGGEITLNNIKKCTYNNKQTGGQMVVSISSCEVCPPCPENCKDKSNQLVSQNPDQTIPETKLNSPNCIDNALKDVAATAEVNEYTLDYKGISDLVNQGLNKETLENRNALIALIYSITNNKPISWDSMQRLVGNNEGINGINLARKVISVQTECNVYSLPGNKYSKIKTGIIAQYKEVYFVIIRLRDRYLIFMQKDNSKVSPSGTKLTCAGGAMTGPMWSTAPDYSIAEWNYIGSFPYSYPLDNSLDNTKKTMDDANTKLAIMETLFYFIPFAEGTDEISQGDIGYGSYAIIRDGVFLGATLGSKSAQLATKGYMVGAGTWAGVDIARDPKNINPLKVLTVAIGVVEGKGLVMKTVKLRIPTKSIDSVVEKTANCADKHCIFETHPIDEFLQDPPDFSNSLSNKGGAERYMVQPVGGRITSGVSRIYSGVERIVRFGTEDCVSVSRSEDYLINQGSSIAKAGEDRGMLGWARIHSKGGGTPIIIKDSSGNLIPITIDQAIQIVRKAKQSAIERVRLGQVGADFPIVVEIESTSGKKYIIWKWKKVEIGSNCKQVLGGFEFHSDFKDLKPKNAGKNIPTWP